MDELKEMPTFVCEICGMKTPITCEGREPNVCNDCLPLYADNTKQDCLYDLNWRKEQR